MLRKLITLAVALGFCGLGIFYVLTIPKTLDVSDLPSHNVDLANGETLFWAGGCASCHAAPNAKGNEKLVLSGGQSLETPFGAFHVPNISSSKTYGIGDWQAVDFVNAMRYGTSPDGSHYYPAFPFTNFQAMPVEDLLDLKAYMDGLPSSDNVIADHDLGFPINIRRGLGFWKLLYLDGESYSYAETRPGAEKRGEYLADAVAHCGACHTPRDALGGELKDQQYKGSIVLAGHGDKAEGRVPDISNSSDGIADWTEEDLVYSFQSGFKPDFDSFGGGMVAVQENLSKLTPEDQKAIARYFKTLP